MGFSRAFAPNEPPTPEALTSAMVGIGMKFAAPAFPDPNIEDTVLFASMAAIEQDDFRVLGMLVSWFDTHGEWLNVDRLTKLVAANGSTRLTALWSALAQGRSSDRRFARLIVGHRGPRQDALRVGSSFHVQRHGEAARFKGTALRVPGNLLRDRPSDVIAPSELARRHRAYRYRVMIGPTFRADMWAALESSPTLSAASLARTTYGSFATAWHVRRDFALLASSRKTARPRGARKLSRPFPDPRGDARDR